MAKSRYYGTRSRRSYTAQRSGGGVIFGVTVLVLTALLYFGTRGQAGDWVRAQFEPLVAMLSGSQLPEPTSPQSTSDIPAWVEAEDTPLPSDTALPDTLPEDTSTPQPSASNTVTEIVELPGVLLYTVQVGAFREETNAQKAALEDKADGGAGFVLQSGDYYRVFRAGFRLNAKAVAMKEELQKGGAEAGVYPIEAPGLKLEITSGQERVQDVRDSFAGWEAALDELELISELPYSQGSDKLRVLRDGLFETAERLDKGLAAEGRNAIYQGLIDLYREAIELIDRNLQIGSGDGLSFCSAVRYNYIELVQRYGQYVGRITAPADAQTADDGV